MFDIDYAWQDHISFMLCDYRQIPTHRKYDRIISWLVQCLVLLAVYIDLIDFLQCGDCYK
jgi:hypothetical protein